MRYVLRDPLAWDLVLSVNVDSVPSNHLGKGLGNTLGESFWLGTPTAKDTVITLVGAS